MSKEMKSIELSETPHNTCRLFVDRQVLRKNKDLDFLLDGLSIWGGADWTDDTHTAWEFDLSLYDKLRKFKEKYLHYNG